MKLSKKIISFLILIFTGGLINCAKDKDLDDFKRDRFEKDFGKLQAVQGKYTGYLNSKKDDSILGALQIELKASTQVQNSTDQSKATMQPILVANIEFLGISPMAIFAQNSSYYPETGLFQVDIPVQKQSSDTSQMQTTQKETAVIKLTGVIQNGVINGTVEALGFSDYGGNFSLSSKAEPLESLTTKKKPTKNLFFSQLTYSGITQFKEGTTKPVDLILLKPQTTSEMDFLNMLAPVRSVLLTLNYGNGARILFENGLWDLRTGTLTGLATISNSQTMKLSLSCQTTEQGKAFNCLVSNSGLAAGTVAQIQVEIAGDDHTPPDSSKSRDSISHVYKGLAQINPTSSYPTIIKVDYNARGRFDDILDLYFPQSEQTLVTTLQIQPPYANPGKKCKLCLHITFQKTKWDSVSSTLDATEVITTSTGTTIMTLSCKNFRFQDEKQTYDFDCKYSSTLKNITGSEDQYVQFRFKSN